MTEKDKITGAIKETQLECSYHGWTFQGEEGKCTGIPQLSGCSSLVSSSVARAATASPRACATPRPCRVAQGMLWIWGEGPKMTVDGKNKRRSKKEKSSSGFHSSSSSGSESDEGGGEELELELETEEEDPISRMFREADEKEPIYAPGISVEDPEVPSDAPKTSSSSSSTPTQASQEKLLTLAGRYYRDVEYDATTLIDNLMDASHLAFAHNRVLGDRDAADAGDVAAARVSLNPETGEEVETPALSAVLSSTQHKREKKRNDKGEGGEGGEQQHQYLDRHSAGARALKNELLFGDAAVFDSAFHVPRTDTGRMLTRILFEPPALATWFCDKPDGDPVCAGSRWRVRR